MSEKQKCLASLFNHFACEPFSTTNITAIPKTIAFILKYVILTKESFRCLDPMCLQCDNRGRISSSWPWPLHKVISFPLMCANIWTSWVMLFMSSQGIFSWWIVRSVSLRLHFKWKSWKWVIVPLKLDSSSWQVHNRMSTIVFMDHHTVEGKMLI